MTQPTTTRAVVIGGGIAGLSALYHLTREGWTDVVLLERDELTSGTTWHSAAQVTSFGMSQVMVALKAHSIRLYRELAADPDTPVGYHYGDGGLRLAGTEAQMEAYRHFASQAEPMGTAYEIVDAAEAARRHPLISPDGLAGALWDPHDGDIDPAQLCNALAARARKAGAQLLRHTPVTALRQLPDDSWVVSTPGGDITCEVIVNAGGYRCNEIGAMMGVVHPVASMEHQYFVTEAIPEIAGAGHRMPLIRCPIDDFYCRQERDGLLVGFYEQGCKTWGLDGIPPEFTSALCPDDPERIADVLEGAMGRMPCLERAGIKRIVNGPITYTMDGVPLVGPIPGKRNAFCITGLRAGLGEGGGHGWLLAQMIVHGEAEIDTWPLDPRRFGAWATVALTAAKAVEDYQNEFRFHWPHEHRPAGRPARVTPLTDTLRRQGARFAWLNGWERADLYAPEGWAEDHSFRATGGEEIAAAEVRNVHENVGIAEVNGFTRIGIAGADAEAFLARVTCTRMPGVSGRLSLAYALNDHGCLKCEATLARFDDRFWWGSAAAAERHDLDWLTAHVRPGEDVHLTNLTDSHAILLIAGPRAPDLLRAICVTPPPRWLHHTPGEIGRAPADIMAVSFSGERAYEIHLPASALTAAHAALTEAGADLGLKPFGSRAIESMRLEKGYLHWKADILTERDPHETGLTGFLDLARDFHGKAALAARQSEDRLVTLTTPARHAPVHHGATVRDNGRPVGTVTSGGFGHRTGQNIAYAVLPTDLENGSAALTIDILGQPEPAAITDRCLFDPKNTRVRT